MSVVFCSTSMVHYVPSWRTQHVPQNTTDKGRGTVQTVVLYKIDEKHLQWFLIVFYLVSLSLHLLSPKNFRLFHLVFTPYAVLINLRSVNRCIVVALGTFHSAVLYIESFKCHWNAIDLKLSYAPPHPTSPLKVEAFLELADVHLYTFTPLHHRCIRCIRWAICTCGAKVWGATQMVWR